MDSDLNRKHDAPEADTDTVVAAAMSALGASLSLLSKAWAGQTPGADLHIVQDRQRDLNRAIGGLDGYDLAEVGEAILETTFSLLAAILGPDLLGLLAISEGDSSEKRRANARRLVTAVRRGLEQAMPTDLSAGSLISELDDSMRALFSGETMPLFQPKRVKRRHTQSFSLARVKFAMCLIRTDLIAGGMTATEANKKFEEFSNIPWDTARKWPEATLEFLGPRDVARIERDHREKFGMARNSGTDKLCAELFKLKALYRKHYLN